MDGLLLPLQTVLFYSQSLWIRNLDRAPQGCCVCPLMSGVTAGRSAEEVTPRRSLTCLECLHLGQRPGASGGAPLCVTWGYSTWPGLVQAWRPQLITFHTW